MMLTPEQEKQLNEIGQKIHGMFPDMHGNVFFRFNVVPGRKQVNVNIGTEESRILNPTNGNEGK